MYLASHIMYRYYVCIIIIILLLLVKLFVTYREQVLFCVIFVLAVFIMHSRQAICKEGNEPARKDLTCLTITHAQ